MVAFITLVGHFSFVEMDPMFYFACFTFDPGEG
jgi:hypothetical protein